MKSIKKAADYISKKSGKSPKIAVILGSGIENFVDGIELKYADIPGFPPITVSGHSGRLVVSGDVIIMCGRYHYYEGYDMQTVVFPVRVMAALGVKSIILTTATGGINESYAAGDIMLIRDQIMMQMDSPLRGPNIDELGPRFPSVAEMYTPRLRAITYDAARQEGITLQEGIFGYMAGPQYETPAEVGALRILGVDAVSMSTAPEAIAAAHAGLEVCGLAAISNVAGAHVSHEEVLAAGKSMHDKMTKLLKGIIEKLNSEMDLHQITV